MIFNNCYQNFIYEDIIVNGKHDISKKINQFNLNFNSFRGNRVLDIGCAEGYLSLLLASHGAIVTAIDKNKQSLNVLNCISQKFSITMTVSQCDFFDVPNFIYDTIFCISVLHLNGDPIALLKKISESCKEMYLEVQLHKDSIKATKKYQEISLIRHIYPDSNRIAISIGKQSLKYLLSIYFKKYDYIGVGFNGRHLFRASK